MKNSICNCKKPDCNAAQFFIQFIGNDPTIGRQGEVYKKQCKQCGLFYVEYFYEYINHSYSGRWFRANIAENVLSSLQLDEVVTYLENALCYFYGGSFFNTTGKQGSGKLHL